VRSINLEGLRDPRRHVARRPALIRFDFLDGDRRAAHLAGKFCLRQAEALATAAQPLTEGRRSVRHGCLLGHGREGVSVESIVLQLQDGWMADGAEEYGGMACGMDGD
jgi:hypothetical protein